MRRQRHKPLTEIPLADFMNVPTKSIGTTSTPVITSWHLSPNKVLNNLVSSEKKGNQMQNINTARRQRAPHKKRLTYPNPNDTNQNAVDGLETPLNVVSNYDGDEIEGRSAEDAHSKANDDNESISGTNADDDYRACRPTVNFNPHETGDSFGLINALADDSQRVLNDKQLQLKKARKTVQFRDNRATRATMRRKTESNLSAGTKYRKSRIVRKVSTRRKTRLSDTMAKKADPQHVTNSEIVTIADGENKVEAEAHTIDDNVDQQKTDDHFEFAKPALKGQLDESNGGTFVSVRPRRTVQFRESTRSTRSKRSIENKESEKGKSGGRKTENRSSETRRSEHRKSRASRKMSTRRKSRMSNETIDEYVSQIDFDCHSISSTSYTEVERLTSTTASSMTNDSNGETTAKSKPKRSTRFAVGFKTDDSMQDLSFAPRRSEKICMKGGKWRRTIFDLRKIRATTCKI